jgi:ATPase subunit of ABC transporter with duplicated ATPase domains
MAKSDKEKYNEFWKKHGKYFKFAFNDFAFRDRVATLKRFISSTSSDELLSLDDYVARAKSAQKDIWYVSASSKEAARLNPHLERFTRKGIEVLYLLEPVDEIALETLGKFKEYSFKNIEQAKSDALNDFADVEENKIDVPEMTGEDSTLFDEMLVSMREILGDKVLEVTNLTKSFGDRVLIDNLSFSMPKGAIVGIIGANGAGKSTLFKMLSGAEEADSGSIVLGETVKLASVDQFRDSMDNTKTVFQEISEGAEIIKINNYEIPARAYCSRFNFRGNDQQKIIGDLSGGERNRVHLAKLLKTGGNVLLLDEPTNDLDVETLRALEEALLEFPGCAMVISHDRWFLDRIATHILDYRDEGQVSFFEGNYTEYSEWLKKTLGAQAAEPHRIKYKRMTK